MEPSGRRGRRSFSSAEKRGEMTDVEPASGAYQAQVSSRTSSVPGAVAGAAGWRAHHAPEHGRGDAGTGGCAPGMTSPTR